MYSISCKHVINPYGFLGSMAKMLWVPKVFAIFRIAHSHAKRGIWIWCARTTTTTKPAPPWKSLGRQFSGARRGGPVTQWALRVGISTHAGGLSEKTRFWARKRYFETKKRYLYWFVIFIIRSRFLCRLVRLIESFYRHKERFLMINITKVWILWGMNRSTIWLIVTCGW